jgi:modulator of FtsH protease HflK
MASVNLGDAAIVRATVRKRVVDVRVIGGVLAIAWLCSGIYVVGADQQAVVTRWGRVVASRVAPGVHWTWPSPVAQVFKLRVRETKRLTIGLNGAEPINRSQFLTGDRNVLNIRIVVQYAISDPVAFLFRTRDVGGLVESAARGALAQVVASRRVDDLLTTEKVAVQERVQALSEAAVTRYESGVTVLGVVIESIIPPDEVVEAFRLVAAAREDSDRIVREAESYANGVVPVARGEAAQLGSEALGYQTQVVSTAAGDAARFGSLAAEYAKAPRETATRIYLETMDDVLPKLDKVVVGDSKSLDLQFVKRP